AQVIIEDYVSHQPISQPTCERLYHILTLSAPDEKALFQLVQNYIQHIQQYPDQTLANITYSAHLGRTHFAKRIAVVAKDNRELIVKLQNENYKKGEVVPHDSNKIAFLFTGQGSQYKDMAHSLYLTQPVFKNALDECANILKRYLEKDLFEIIWPNDQNSDLLDQTQYTQPAIFAIEYAIFQLWQSFGIKPHYVMGHSVGEYVAATVAGIISLDDGLKLIVTRGKLIQTLPAQATGMLAVKVNHDRINELLKSYPDHNLDIAAYNTLNQIVLSGSLENIQRINEICQTQSIETKLLKTSHAFHSRHMHAISAEFKAQAEAIQYHSPTLTLISNITGQPIKKDEINATYWQKHLLAPVDFVGGITTLKNLGCTVYVEVGPHPVLLSLAAACISDEKNSYLWLPSLRMHCADEEIILQSLAELYVRGISIDWEKFDSCFLRKKVILPTYPFQRQRYWANELTAQQNINKQSYTQNNLFYEIKWVAKPINNFVPSYNTTDGVWLIFSEENSLYTQLKQQLQIKFQTATQRIIQIRNGDHYQQIDNSCFQINFENRTDYIKLISYLYEKKINIISIVHLNSFYDDINNIHQSFSSNLVASQLYSTQSILYLTQALLQQNLQKWPRLLIVTYNVQPFNVTTHNFKHAGVIGLCKSIALEITNFNYIHLYVDDVNIEHLIHELASSSIETQVVYRKNERFIARLNLCNNIPDTASRPISLLASASYLITGGLGGLGLACCRWLIEQGAKNIILVGRQPPSAQLQQEILQLEKIHSLTILIRQVNIAELQQLNILFDELSQQLPPLRGIIHAAGVMKYNELAQQTWQDFEIAYESKLIGAWNLHQITQKLTLDFFILFSSIASVNGAPNLASYAAANTYLEHLAYYRQQQKLPALTINWGPWCDIGMAASFTENNQKIGISSFTEKVALSALKNAFNSSQPQVMIADINWKIFVEFFPTAKNWLSMVLESTKTTTIASNLSEKLKNLTIEKQKILLLEYLQHLIKKFLRLESSSVVDTKLEFKTLGMDSLMAIQIRNQLQSELGENIKLPNNLVYENSNLEKLVNQILGLMQVNIQQRKIAIQSYAGASNYPASFGQMRMFFLHQFLDNKSVYNVPVALKLTGRLDHTTLEHALLTIIDRHSILRTSLKMVGQNLVQLIWPELDFALEKVSINNHKEIQQRLKMEIAKPFNLTKVPLLRATLLQQRNNENILLLVLHHSVFDGVSLGVLIDELVTVYNQKVKNGVSTLPPLPFQYADYSIWQQEWIKSSEAEQQLKAWNELLKTAPTGLNLPIDKRLSSVRTHQGDAYYFSLPESLIRLLKQLSQQHNVTLFTTLLSAYYILLYRYSGQSDIVIGTPVANRNQLEVEKLIGFFVNTLALRIQCDDADSFIDVLHKTDNIVQFGLANAEIPYDQIISHLQLGRHQINNNPLFQVMFILQDESYTNFSGLSLENLSVTEVTTPQISSLFDLTLELRETQEGFFAKIEYSTDLFYRDTIERIAEHFKELLHNIVHNPKQKISHLSLLSLQEKQRVLVEWNQTAAEYPTDKTIQQLFEEQVEKTPHQVAIVFGEQTLNYFDLNQKANQLAHYLLEHGVLPDTLVGVCIERSLELVIGLLAILKTGAAYVPLEPSHPSGRLQYMLTDIRATVLLTQEELIHKFGNHSIKDIFIFNEHWQEKITNYSVSNPLSSAMSSNLAYVIYTSGSTGLPKGVMISHRNVVNVLCCLAKKIPISKNDKWLAITSIGFDIAGLELYLPLITGTQIVLTSKDQAKNAQVLIDLLSSQEITIMQATPATWRMLLDTGYQIHSRLKILTGGEALPEDIATELAKFNNVVWNLYGPTETTIWSTAAQIFPDKQVTIGRPITNTQLYILDTNLQPVPVGVVGELYIGGAGVGQGYLNLGELTAQRFINNPFLSKQDIKKGYNS
ncbi:MAG: amino acid adenylation domain-containing protein, partial [Gammaproteobacteria bacterium]